MSKTSILHPFQVCMLNFVKKSYKIVVPKEASLRSRSRDGTVGRLQHSKHAGHRVGRVLSFFSSRRNWDSPNPSPARECVPPPPLWFWEEGHTRWRERGWESPSSNEGTYTVVLFIYVYFVMQVHCRYCHGPCLLQYLKISALPLSA
jgi:hypothetical protein